MKKLLLFISLACVMTAQAQNTRVSYKDVLEKFFYAYQYTPGDPVEGLNFARKREGWFVQVIDRVNETVKKEALFWSPQSGWQTLDGFESPLPEDKQSEMVYQFLSGQASLYQFIGYERCHYYGYNGWDMDMIQDFGYQPLSSLTDTLLEGLGRAYSAYATRFSWYQFGGNLTEGDSLKRKLLPLERPSKQRTDSIVHYIRKAIACYDVLKKRSPSYQTLVGNSGMKHFNEQMFGYNQLMMAGYEEKARSFLQEIAPNETIIRLAKNYLSNCPLNAILISYGDIDTYPLWYVQEVLKFRTDVTVLNQNLMGLPIYVEQLRRKNSVHFSAMPEVYGDPRFQYGLYEKRKDVSAQQMPLAQFLRSLYTRQYAETPTYPVKEVVLSVDPAKIRKVSNQPGLGKTVRFTLGDYLTLDQMIILDIIQANFYKRPICFTFRYELSTNNLQSLGFVYQLLPLHGQNRTAHTKTSIQKIESFLSKDFHFISAGDVSTGISPQKDFNLNNFQVVGQLVEWYWQQGNKAKARQWMNRLQTFYRNEYPASIDSYPGYLFFLVGDTATGLRIFENNARFLYDLYKNPSPVYPIMNKEMTTMAIEKLRTELSYQQLTSATIEKIKAMLETE